MSRLRDSRRSGNPVRLRSCDAGKAKGMATSAIQDTWTLDADQLRAIEIGLRARLRTRRIPEAFIERNLEDLAQEAIVEYTRARERGDEISNPGGWIVHTASFRAIDAVRRESREIDVPDEVMAEDPDQSSPPSEEEAIEHLQVEELHHAMGRLSVSQRRALSLAFFEEKTTREGARALGWSESTFRRRRDSAVEALRKRLGVTVPEIEIGLAAWLSLSAGQGRAHRVVEPLVSAGESVRSGLAGVGEKGRDLVSRFLSSGGGEATISAAGPVGRAAGVCATAAVAACAATGVIGPGIGGVDLVDRGGQTKPPVREARTDDRPRPEQPAARTTIAGPTSSPETRPQPEESRQAGTNKGNSSGSTRGREATKKATSQFSVESQASPTPTPSPPPAPIAPAPSPVPPSTPDQVANDQFGLP